MITGLDATPFIGRRSELAEIRQRLATSRLVTVLGPGGVGKTRLAFQLAGELVDQAQGAVWAVELAELSDPGLVPLVVAESMGLHAQPQDPLTAGVAAYVGERPAVLVLDNCEHLTAACRTFVHHALAGCPRLRVLVTTREPLGLTSETLFLLRPLPVPPPGPGPGVDAAVLAQVDSVRLFVGRAAAVAPDFTLDDANAADVARICELLDGLPLALELAAARLRVLPPAALLRRLEEGPSLLSHGEPDRPGRHRSLEATVAWSYELCTPEERLLWQRLSVFSGEFHLDAAETVCAGEGIEPEALIELLTSLIDKSVVMRQPDGPEPFYRLLETIRAYGAARLAEGGEDARVRGRHRVWLVALADRFGREWIGPDQAALLELVRRNHGNLQAVLEEVCGDPCTAPLALQVGACLENSWVVSGTLREARHWLDLAEQHGTGTPGERASGLALSGYLAALQLELDRAAECLRLARALVPDDDDAARGRVWFLEGLLAMFNGDAASAVAPLEAAASAFTSAGAWGGRAAAKVALGMALSWAGSQDEARSVKHEALRESRRAGERLHASYLSWSLATDALADGDVTGAVDLLADAAADKTALGDTVGLAIVLETFADVANAEGDPLRSAVLRGAAWQLWARVGFSPYAAPYIVAQREHGEQRTRSELGDSFDQAYRRGLRMSTAEAVAVALGARDEPATVPDPRPTPLTAREEEVAALIAEGMTDQQIASRLSISVRTAQAHVQNILRKLHFASRTQVAAWVASGSPAAPAAPDSTR